MIPSEMDISVWQNGAMQLSVGAAIRKRREARGWKQETLGKRAGTNKETVNRAEMGANVTVDTLLKIARALDTTLEITLRDPSGATDVVRDVTSPVTGASEREPAPGEERRVPNPSLPQSAVHLTLYGMIGDLTEDQARSVRRPLLDLIERTQKPDTRKTTKDNDKARP